MKLLNPEVLAQLGNARQPGQPEKGVSLVRQEFEPAADRWRAVDNRLLGPQGPAWPLA